MRNASAEVASCPMGVSNRYGLIFRLVKKGVRIMWQGSHTARLKDRRPATLSWLQR